VRIFNFHDDNFVLDDKPAMLRRLHQLGAALAERGVTNGVAFAIKCRPDVVDMELFALLKAMGMFRVFLGIEAGTPESLRQLGRGQTVEDNVRALDILRKLDVHTCFNLLVLNPDSTLEDLARNVKFLRRHPHHAMNFCRTEIYAGTPLERRLRKQGRLLGDYWGYDYRITDPRAQLAFEIFYPAFEARNYGDEGLHHLTMQIDYEQQLLGRFFGSHEALRRRVKKLIVTVNHNTCDHLEGLVSGIPRLETDADRVDFAAEIKAGVERDNERLGRQVRELLEEIRMAPERPASRKRARGWMQAAAGAGLAATVSLTATACKDKSHSTEMVAIPTATASGPPPRDAGAAEPDASDAMPALGPSALVKPTLAEKLLPVLAQKVVPLRDVEIELWVSSSGAVEKVSVVEPKLDPEAEKKIVEAVRAQRFENDAAKGQRFVVRFERSEIEGASADAAPKPIPVPTTHMKERVPRPEMAPRPPPPRPEMAPRPPKPDKSGF